MTLYECKRVVFDSFYSKLDETFQIICANEKQHFIHIHVFTDALALRCTSEARLRTQLVERKGEGGEHTDQRGHTLLHILYML